MYFRNIPRVYCILVMVGVVFFTEPAWAIRELTWAPSGDYDWKDTSNWDGPSGQFPDDDEDVGIFPTKGAIGDPYLDGDLSGTGGGLGQLIFNDAGWTIWNEAGEDNVINFNSLNYFSYNAIYSSGSGTNRIKPKVSFLNAGQNVYTGTGNKLVFEQLTGSYPLVVSSMNPTSADTGAIRLEGNNSSLTSAFLVRQGTLEVAHSNALGSGGGTIYFGDSWSTNEANARLLTDGAYTVSKNLEVRNIADHLVNATIGGKQTTGASTFTGTVTLQRDAWLTSANTDGNPVLFYNTISGAGGITKIGAGTVTLGHANSYQGATNINAGMLKMGAAGALPSTTAVTLANSAGVVLNLNGYSQTIASLSGGGGSGGAVMLGSAQLTVDSGNYYGTLTGAGGSLRKTGTGLLTLGGNNSYTGTTMVSAGTLLVHGTHTNGGDYTVSSDATLAGGGDIDANIYIAPGGFLNRGQASDFISVMSSDVEIDGTLKVGLSPEKMGTADRIYVECDLDITQATVDFNELGTLDDPAYVFAWYGTLTGGQFASVLHLPAGYHIDYAYVDDRGDRVIALVIPEPVSLTLMLVGCAGLLRRRGHKDKGGSL